MSGRKTSSLQRFDPLKLLLLLIPAAVYVIPGLFLMGTNNTFYVVRFMLTILLFVFASYPLAVKLFPLSRSGGFTLAKPLGLLASGLLVWTLTYLKLFRFNTVFIIISLVIIGFCCWFPKPLRDGAIDRLKEEGTLENIAFEESLYALALILMCFFKGYYPDINGQEKFMDYGFLMSMVRNSSLPANDMWLAGYSINYYYFGQYIYALLTRLSGIPTGVAYNVSMCCSIALPFSLCYSIGQMLIDGARAHGMKCGKIPAIIGGILTSLAVTIFGNSHSFYYDENSIGNGLLNIFSKLGIDVGRTDSFFYPDSTRYIGYNPDSALIEGIRNGGDYTIEEFPFYSYLVGDLHAHVCSTMVVLLIMALAVSLVNRVYEASLQEPPVSSVRRAFIASVKTELRLLLTPEIIAVSVLLGICQMTNYWDFLIYFIFGSMLLLVINTYRSRHFSTVVGVIMFIDVVAAILGLYLVTAYIPLFHAALQILVFIGAIAACAWAPCSLTRTSAGMSFLFTVATVVALPFNFNFEMISNKLAPCVNHSSPYQLFILWGTHVIICMTFIVFTIIFRNSVSSKGKKKAATVSFSNPVEKFFKERNPMDVLMCGSIIVGLLLLIAPEIFYVRDIYTGGYLRSNTMFKFTYAGFIILSVCMIYAVMRLLFAVNNQGEFSTPAFVIAIVFCFLLFIPAHYPLAALKQRNGDLSLSNYKTIDGTAYIATYTSPYPSNVSPGNLVDYNECIRWFNNNVEGSPVILEAYGDSYTDYNIVSAYTGLPTVCGWQTHEWLWRFHGIVDKETDLLVSDPMRDVWILYLTPRHTDIDIMYTADDPNIVSSLLSKYNVSYVIIGDLERSKYGGYDNTAVFASLGEIVYSYGNVMVIKII
ncbi:MAG: hypothetical protein IJ757_09125 [Clostridiales bacterium]|nr:hypothetical protein [Clostridiales bacterium]